MLVILDIILGGSLGPRRRLGDIHDAGLNDGILIDLLRIGVDISKETLRVRRWILRLEKRVESTDFSADRAVVFCGLADPVDEGLGLLGGFAFDGFLVFGVDDGDLACCWVGLEGGRGDWVGGFEETDCLARGEAEVVWRVDGAEVGALDVDCLCEGDIVGTKGGVLGGEGGVDLVRRGRRGGRR